MTVDGLDRMESHIKSFKKELSSNESTKRLLRHAKMVMGEADTAAASAVGADRGFTGGRKRGSGWRTKTGALVVADVEAKAETVMQVAIRPKPKVRGPWRVMESGRRAYEAGSQREAGKYTRKKTGERVQRMRSVNRTVGATRGWRAWTKAEKRMARRVRVDHTKDVIRTFRRTFGGR